MSIKRKGKKILERFTMPAIHANTKQFIPAILRDTNKHTPNNDRTLARTVLSGNVSFILPKIFLNLCNLWFSRLFNLRLSVFWPPKMFILSRHSITWNALMRPVKFKIFYFLNIYLTFRIRIILIFQNSIL